jgi:hypothetical protein
MAREGALSLVFSRNVALVPIEPIARSIRILRGQKVLLDADLAALYGITTASLNQQVRRNRGRFAADFLFELTSAEVSALMMQNATSKPGRGGRRKLPLAFTEHGATMAATVLNSPRAAEMTVYVVRAFVKLPIGFTANLEQKTWQFGATGDGLVADHPRGDRADDLNDPFSSIPFFRISAAADVAGGPGRRRSRSRRRSGRRGASSRAPRSRKD